MLLLHVRLLIYAGLLFFRRSARTWSQRISQKCVSPTGVESLAIAR